MRTLILIGLFLLSTTIQNSQAEEINVYIWSEYIA